MAHMVNRDVEHLKLLAVFHYVLGGIVMLLGLLPLIYVLMGIVFINMPDEQFAPTPGPAPTAPAVPTPQIQPGDSDVIEQDTDALDAIDDPDFRTIEDPRIAPAPPPNAAPVAPAPMPPMGGPPPGLQRTIGLGFIIFGVVACLMGEAIGAMMLFAGYKLGRASNRTFCFVVAVIECFWIPFGTILGVFTIVVLCRASVADRFAGRYVEPDPYGDAPPPLPR